MERQRVLNLGFVSEHEKLRRNTNTFWGPEMAPFIYTSSRWGVDSSREGSPDSNIGSSYQPAPTTDSSASGPCARFGKKKRVLSPVTRSPSPPLLPIRRQPMHPYGGIIGVGRRAGKRSARKGVLIPLQGSHSSPPGSSRDPLLSPERVRSPTPLEYIEDDEPMKEGELDWTEWVPNPHLNRLGEWLADVDLGKPPSNEETARARFGLCWSSEEEREEVEVQEDFNNSEIEGLIRTHTRRPPRR